MESVDWTATWALWLQLAATLSPISLSPSLSNPSRTVQLQVAAQHHLASQPRLGMSAAAIQLWWWQGIECRAELRPLLPARLARRPLQCSPRSRSSEIIQLPVTIIRNITEQGKEKRWKKQWRAGQRGRNRSSRQSRSTCRPHRAKTLSIHFPPVKPLRLGIDGVDAEVGDDESALLPRCCSGWAAEQNMESRLGFRRERNWGKRNGWGVCGAVSKTHSTCRHGSVESTRPGGPIHLLHPRNKQGARYEWFWKLRGVLCPVSEFRVFFELLDKFKILISKNLYALEKNRGSTSQS